MEKILIVNSFYYPTIIGGAEISTKLLAEDLKENYEVYVLTTGNHKNNIIKEVINGINIIRLPNSNIYSHECKKNRSSIQKLIWHTINTYNPLQKKVIEKVIREVKPNLIHSQNLSGIGTYLWEVGSKFNIPIIHTTRDYSLFSPINNKLLNNVFSKINRNRSENVNGVVGISSFILKKHIEYKFFPYASQGIIHNVINIKRYERKERKQGDPLTIGFFGQLEEIKGVHLLVEAVKLIKKDVVRELIICGAGSLESSLRIESNNDSRIKIKGKVSPEEVSRQMANVDIVVVPSIWDEPFGRIIIESYNQGTPVIGSNVGGIPEIIFEKDYLLHEVNIESIKDKLELEYNKTSEEISNNIRKSYQSSENYKENINSYKDFYNSIKYGDKFVR